MSNLKAKILTSGCGFSWSGQQRKTWINVLKAAGADVTDVGGPAVSNQWIINNTFKELLKNSYNYAIIQITSLGKLDVEINDERFETLVKTDSLRNFTIDGVWPSSVSRDHESKKLYYKWLQSPGLELDDLYVKLLLLNHWCETNNVTLLVIQAYTLPWTEEQKNNLGFVKYIDSSLNDQYVNSEFYNLHDFSDSNGVPCVKYQIEIARQLASIVSPEILNKINKIDQLTK